MGWKHTTEVLCQNNFQREKWSICCNQSSNITECALSSYIKPESSNLKIPACCSLFCHHEWRSFGPCFIYYMSVYPFFFFTALFPLPVSQNLSILQLSTSSVSLWASLCVCLLLKLFGPSWPWWKNFSHYYKPDPCGLLLCPLRSLFCCSSNVFMFHAVPFSVYDLLFHSLSSAFFWCSSSALPPLTLFLDHVCFVPIFAHECLKY